MKEEDRWKLVADDLAEILSRLQRLDDPRTARALAAYEALRMNGGRGQMPEFLCPRCQLVKDPRPFLGPCAICCLELKHAQRRRS